MAARRWLTPLALTSNSPDWTSGVRVGVSFAGPLAVGIATDRLGLGVPAAIVAMNVGLAAVSASYGRRAAVTAITAVVSSVLFFLGLLAAPSIWMSTVLMTAVATGSGFFVLYGAVGTALGLGLPVAVLIALGLPPASFAHAVDVLIACLLGGAWTVLVSIAFWPFFRDRPIRAAVVTLFEETAAMAAGIGMQLADTRSGDDTVEGKTRADVIAAQESAMAATHGASWRSGRFGDALRRLRRLTIDAENVGVAALAVARRFSDHERAAPVADLAELFSIVARAFSQAASEIPDARIESPIAANAASVAIEATRALETRAHDALRPELAALRAALEGLVATLDARAPARAVATEAYRGSPFTRLAANLNKNSVTARHSVRFGITIAVATLLWRLAEIPDGYWIILTVVVLMKPDLGATLDRIVQRIVGTVVGAAVGAVLIVVLTDQQYATLLIAAFLVVLMVAYISVNYVLWVLALTPMVLLTLGLLFPGDWELALWRIVDTLIGAALTVVAVYALWPSRGLKMLPHLAAAEIRATCGYLEAVVAGSQSIESQRGLRRRAALAESNAEVGVQQYRNEPGSSRDTAGTWQSVVLAGRSVRDRVIALSLELSTTQTRLDRSEQRTGDRLVTRLETIADDADAGNSPHVAEESDATTRMFPLCRATESLASGVAQAGRATDSAEPLKSGG